MFDPKLLVSPLSAAIDILRRQNNDTYALLLTKEGIEVVGTENSSSEYNTTAVVNELDTDGNITKLGRVIEYDRVDLEKLIRENTNLIVGQNNIAAHHLLSYRDLRTIRNPSNAQIAQVLRLHYNLPIDPIDLKTTSQYGLNSPFNKDNEPRPKGTYPLIVNGTIENTLYTYIGGSVPVSHRTVCPTVVGIEDTMMALGLQVVRQLTPKETIELTLPLIRDEDSWTIMFESMLIAHAERKGNLWFKLKLSISDNVWVLHVNDQPPLRFTGEYLVVVKIIKIGHLLTIEGEDFNGNKNSITIEGPRELITDELQRITAYTSNPLPRTLQFKLKSSNDNTLITAADTVTADPLSNAVFTKVSSPIIITDAILNNYAESDIDRFVSRFDNVTKGGVTKLTQFNDSVQSTIDVSITNFYELCLDGKFKQLEINVINVNDENDKLRVSYKIMSTDIIDKTAQVVVSINGEDQPVTTVLLYDLSGMFKVNQCPTKLKVFSSDDILGSVDTNVSGIGPYQYRVEFNVELNVSGKLPTMTFNKTITPVTQK